MASTAAHVFKVYYSIVRKRNTLVHTNRITRLQGALREYLQAVIRRCLRHNHTKVSMLALGGDSVDEDESYWAQGLEDHTPHRAND